MLVAPIVDREHELSQGRLVPLELYMVGVIVGDMRSAVEFYRRLGVAIPDDAEDLSHVEVEMGSLRFFLNTSESNARWDPVRQQPSGGYRIILEFDLGSASAVDAKYHELIAYGYSSHAAPYDVGGGAMRFALVDDPDQNTVLLSGPHSTSLAGP